MKHETFEREEAARESITRFVAAKYQDHSERWHRGLAGMIVAERFAFLGWLGEIGSGDDVQLRQQAESRQDDIEFWQELEYESLRNVEHARHMQAAIRAGHVDRYDPDARDQDRENGRLREERQDEHANREAVRP